jgi:transaldolase
LLQAVCAAGSCLYIDSADSDEIAGLSSILDGDMRSQVAGNTTNQQFIRQRASGRLDRYCGDGWWADLDRLVGAAPGVPPAVLGSVVVGARVGGEIVRAVDGVGSWEVSLPLPMSLCGQPAAAREAGRFLCREVPEAMVKVAMTPHDPRCLSVARDLEYHGVPVNFTCTFSARQAVVAAILAGVQRANVFLGRLNLGLGAPLLGEHVALATQRSLHELRRKGHAKTALIVANLRDWPAMARVAGCDYLTAPPAVIRELLSQEEVLPEDLADRHDTSYEDAVAVSEPAGGLVPRERLNDLSVVEPELVDFVLGLRHGAHSRAVSDGDALLKAFEEAGFGDFFYCPTEEEWTAIRRHRLPDLRHPLSRELPLDTLLSLLAAADFQFYQDRLERDLELRGYLRDVL